LDDEFDKIFKLVEGTTKRFGEKFKEVDKTINKIKEDKESGAGFSPA